MASENDSPMAMQAHHSPCSILQDNRHDIIPIDKHGDKYLEVGRNSCTIDTNGDHTHTTAKTFRVCSRSLARASPVMEAMFFSRFREAHETHVSFPDDSPHLMDMLIRLAHGDTSGFDHLNAEENLYSEDGSIDPLSTFADEVYDILVLANKYLMTQKLGPFRSLWINQLKEWEIYITYPDAVVMAPNHLNQLEKYMWMASELGTLSLYTSAFPYLIWHRRRDDDLFQSVPEPEGAADHIRWGYLQEVEDCLAPIRNAIRAWETDIDPTNSYLCKQPRREDRQRCQENTLSIMVESLRQKGLWPLPDAKDVGQYLRSFVWDIESLVMLLEPLHKDCVLETIEEQIMSSRDKSHTENAVPPEPLREAIEMRAKQF
ncbi:hypothetical protein BJ166DRAFT_611723 [Pestalotiopsis sp. NC0098]|nr:hypothetical protein BJ166DRAFT_611723 [Pestalotiopsis sp. NC0098]